MAVLFCDSFDHYGAPSASGILQDKWYAVGFGATSANVSGMDANKGTISSSIWRPMTPGDTTCIIGIGFRSVGWPIGENIFEANLFSVLDSTAAGALSPKTFGGIQLFDNGTQLSLLLNGVGGIEVRRGQAAAILGVTRHGLLTAGVFHVIEMKAVIHASAGSIVLRVNGEEVLNVSGINTQFTANTSWNLISLGARASSVDNFYVCDGTGGAPGNDFLGDIHIEALRPQTDAVAAGTNAGLTPSSGTDHGAMVDEATPNSDTDYNAGATAGVKDTYNYPSMVNTGTIYGIQTCLHARKVDNVGKTLAPVVRSGGTDYDGTPVDVGDGWHYYCQMYALDPATGVAWTSGGVNAVEVGMKTVA